MDHESLGEQLLSIVLMALDKISGNPLASATHAVLNGDPTDEQLNAFTESVHNGFELADGCMVDVVNELSELHVPHYAINHAIRTYVRRCDNVESEAAVRRDESHNARYGKAAQGAAYKGGMFDRDGFTPNP